MRDPGRGGRHLCPTRPFQPGDVEVAFATRHEDGTRAYLSTRGAPFECRQRRRRQARRGERQGNETYETSPRTRSSIAPRVLGGCREMSPEEPTRGLARIRA